MEEETTPPVIETELGSAQKVVLTDEERSALEYHLRHTVHLNCVSIKNGEVLRGLQERL